MQAYRTNGDEILESFRIEKVFWEERTFVKPVIGDLTGDVQEWWPGWGKEVNRVTIEATRLGGKERWPLCVGEIQMRLYNMSKEGE